MPIIPSFPSSAVKACLWVPSLTDMLAVAIDKRARTRSRGYVAPAISSPLIFYSINSHTATTPAPAPAVSRKGVESDVSPDHLDSRFLNAPYVFRQHERYRYQSGLTVNCKAE